MSNCSLPNPMALLSAASCSTEPGYYATQEEIEEYMKKSHASGKAIESAYMDVFAPATVQTKQEFKPSCSSTIGIVDYQQLLDKQSNRYADKVASVYDKVGTQAINQQQPAPFLMKGGEYRDAYYMNDATGGCGQNFYTGAGFVPGSYSGVDPFPKSAALLAMDNPLMMNALTVPGIVATYALSTPEAQDMGRRTALSITPNETDTITRLVMAEEVLEPLKPQMKYLHNPGEFVTSGMRGLYDSIYTNQTSQVSGNMYDTVAPSVGMSFAVPTGFIRNVVDNRARWVAWQDWQNGQNTGLEALNRRALNGDAQFAYMRALLNRPRGQYFSGPIMDSMQEQTGTPVSDMAFYHEPVSAQNFVNQKNYYPVSLQP